MRIGDPTLRAQQSKGVKKNKHVLKIRRWAKTLGREQ
jgi:hypothetical protein